MSKIGRNDPCWCGSEEKFKRCHWPSMPPEPPTEPLSQDKKIEIAKAVKAVRDAELLDDQRLGELKALMADPSHHEAIDRAISGLSEEDEFALICRNIGTATHMVRLDQNPLIRNRAIAPDFLVRFQAGFPGRKKREDAAGFRCLIEVKSTEKAEFTIRGGALRRRLEFASAFGLPLLLAVRFLRFGRNSLWAMADATRHTGGRLRLGPEDLMRDGLRRVLWLDHSVLLFPGTQVLTTYNRAEGIEGPRLADLGVLTSMRIRNRSREFPIEGPTLPTYSVLMNAFGVEERRRRERGTVTRVLSTPNLDFATATMPDLIMALHHGFGLVPGQVLTSEAARDLPRLDRDVIYSLLDPLYEAQMIANISHGEDDEAFDAWQTYFGPGLNTQDG
ncbi:MAG: SEC-C metal-binding domain-containing protein [Planctomycetota bacterium]